MKKNQIIIIAVIIVVLIVVGLLKFGIISKDGISPDGQASNRGVGGTSLGVTLDFYEKWLDARKSTTTDPYALNLGNEQALSVEMSERIAAAENTFRTEGADIVLCGQTIPEKIRAKSIFETGEAGQVLIRPGDKETQTQSVVSLIKHDDLWEITNIECGASEVAPETGEFNFDTEGFLLKDSLPAAMNKNNWYVVFDQNGTPGHTAALHLDDTSVCIDQQGNESPCQTSMFFEAAHAIVQGNMTEAGVNVKYIKFIE